MQEFSVLDKIVFLKTHESKVPQNVITSLCKLPYQWFVDHQNRRKQKTNKRKIEEVIWKLLRKQKSTSTVID